VWTVGPLGALRHRNLVGWQKSITVTTGTVTVASVMRMGGGVDRPGFLVLLESIIPLRSWEGTEPVCLGCG